MLLQWMCVPSGIRTFLCNKCNCYLFQRPDTDHQYCASGGSLADSDNVDRGEFTSAGTSHNHENSETESYVLYCFRIQGYISDEKLVLGAYGMDCLFLGIYNSVFPVWKLGI